jgi:hypothetical protein
MAKKDTFVLKKYAKPAQGKTSADNKTLLRCQGVGLVIQARDLTKGKIALSDGRIMKKSDFMRDHVPYKDCLPSKPKKKEKTE